MVGLELLTAARDAGLRVEVIDGRLVIQGPKRAEEIAQRLISNKAAVVAAYTSLAEVGRLSPPLPTEAGSVLPHIGDMLDGWVLRPDVEGRLGWESPLLRNEDRWWARCREEDLPQPGWWQALLPPAANDAQREHSKERR